MTGTGTVGIAMKKISAGVWLKMLYLPVIKKDLYPVL